MEEMKNRVYGVVGIKSILSNWNADFTARPRSTSDNNIFGSDKAFKYPIKKMWEMNGEKVLYIKSYKTDKTDIKPRNLSERYDKIYPKKLKDTKQKSEVIENLFSAIDVQNFGATFAEKNDKISISITGAVQIGQGYNKYENTNIEIIDILSPFRNKDTDMNTTLGNKFVVDEAHYMYPFSVNPQNYDIYKEVCENFTGYTKEAYDKFKKACLVAATAYNTNSKAGCENEFAIFVECKNESKIYLANLDQYVNFIKGEKIDIIDISKLMEILKSNLSEIENIEIYYNKYTTKLVGAKEEKNITIKSLY